MGGLLPGELAIGAARGGECVVDRALGLLDRRRLREVVGQLRQVGIEVGAAQALDRLADASVQPRPAQLREPVVQGRAHERVREGVAADTPRLAQDPGLDALLERADQRFLLERRDRMQHVVVELAADHRRHRERLARLRVEPPQAPRCHLAHAVRDARLGERDVGLQCVVALAQVADDLLDEERIAVGLAVQGVHEGRLGARHAERGDQLGHLGLRQAAHREVLEHAFAADVGDQLVQRVTRLDLGLAVGAEQQRAARLRRAHEMTQELERGAVGPVEVVEDEHQRPRRAGLGEQRGHRVEEAEAVAVGGAVVGGRRPELAEQDPELGGAHAETFAQRVERGARGPAAHHLDHRLVGRDRLLVEAPVEHQRAVVARAAAQLGGQAGLADAGVPGQQDELADAGHRLVPVLLEHAELARASDERLAAEGGGERRRPGDRRDLVGARLGDPGGGSLAAQEPLVDGHRRSTRGGAQLVAQQDAQLLEGAQRLGRVPRRLVHLHQQPVRRLTERHRRDRGASGLLGGPELAAALPQARLAQHLEGAHAHGLQLAPALGHPRAVAVGQEGLEVGRQHVAGGGGRARPVVGVDRRFGLGGGGRRELHIDVDRARRHDAQLRPAGERALAERAAQLREQRAERAVGSGGRPLGPQEVDQLGPAAVAVAVEDEVGEEQSPLPPRESRRPGLTVLVKPHRPAQPNRPPHVLGVKPTAPPRFLQGFANGRAATFGAR